jgi:hypothetical protein
MDEVFWGRSRSPRDLLSWVRDRKRRGLYHGDPDGRASRLLACAVARHRLASAGRRFWGRQWALRAVEEGEAYALRPRADRTGQTERMRQASQAAWDAIDHHCGLLPAVGAVEVDDATAGGRPHIIEALDAAVEASACRVQLDRVASFQDEDEAGIVRHVFACPFRAAPLIAVPSGEARSLAWASARLAAGGGWHDAARLLVLSDCLEEGGYADEALLAHLREAGPHPAGCWAVLGLLGL